MSCYDWLKRTGLKRTGLAIGLILLTGCGMGRVTSPIEMHVQQQWQLQPGDRIAGYEVTSGLGDIVIDLAGQRLHMPVDGKIEPLETRPNCALFSSAEIPAYRLRLCGLERQRWGDRKQGDTIGRGHHIAVAMLRKQPDGTWAMVEPATELLEKFLDVR